MKTRTLATAALIALAALAALPKATAEYEQCYSTAAGQTCIFRNPYNGSVYCNEPNSHGMGNLVLRHYNGKEYVDVGYYYACDNAWWCPNCASSGVWLLAGSQTLRNAYAPLGSLRDIPPYAIGVAWFGYDGYGESGCSVIVFYNHEMLLESGPYDYDTYSCPEDWAPYGHVLSPSAGAIIKVQQSRCNSPTKTTIDVCGSGEPNAYVLGVTASDTQGDVKVKVLGITLLDL